ncbi:MAG: hypothetical protein ABI878_15045 [Acidobacteriota bacterium]
MIRQWKEFEGGANHPAKRERLHATLNKKGIILFNEKVFEAMGRPEAAVLLFDERQQTIGVRPAHAGERNIFPVRQKPGVSYRTICARPFCRHFGLNVPQTVAFPAAGFDREGILVLDLHSAIDVKRV